MTDQPIQKEENYFVKKDRNQKSIIQIALHALSRNTGQILLKKMVPLKCDLGF